MVQEDSSSGPQSGRCQKPGSGPESRQGLWNSAFETSGILISVLQVRRQDYASPAFGEASEGRAEVGVIRSAHPKAQGISVTSREALGAVGHANHDTHNNKQSLTSVEHGLGAVFQTQHTSPLSPSSPRLLAGVCRHWPKKDVKDEHTAKRILTVN